MTSAGMIDGGGSEFELTLVDNLTKEVGETLNHVSASIRDVVDDISRDVKSSFDGIASSVGQVTGFIDGEIKQLGKEYSFLGKSLAVVGAGAAGFGASALLGFGKAVGVAGDFAETLNMFESVFKSQSAAVRKWGQDYGKEVGRAEAQMLDFLAQSQDTFVPLGFDRKEAAELSKTVTKLAVDLGSFKNIDDGDALRRLLGGLVGNTENLKLFGVQATQAAIKAKALSLGFDPKNLTSYQKALAILEITIDGTQDAQGDAINTAKEYANSVKTLKAELLRLSIAVGTSLKSAITKLVQSLSAAVSAVANLLERFPVLTKIAAALSLALFGIGVAVTGLGIAIAAFGSAIVTFGIVALGSLIAVHGWVGAINVLTAIAARGFVTMGTAASLSFAQASAGAFSFRAILATIPAMFARIIGVVSAAKLSVIFASGTAAVKVFAATTIASLKAVAGFIASSAAAMAPLLANPWFLLAAAIGAATAAAIAYYKTQENRAKERAETLENQRQAIVAESFRSAGQAVPADLSKTLDIEKSKVVGPGSSSNALSQADRDLADEIQSIKTTLEEYRERIQGARRLLARETITKEEFGKFVRQERKEFREQDPRTQARDSLIKQLRTPIEKFREAIAKAKRLFGTEPVMFERARQAAAEQLQANDKGTQLALSLRTPLERLLSTVAEARKLFKESPKNLKRAIDAAIEEFKALDPVEQLKVDLQTPLERFRERMAEVAEILKDTNAQLRGELTRRAEKQATEDLRREAPDLRLTDKIQEGLQTAGAKIVEQLTKAAEIVKKGLLTPEEFDEFRKQLIKGQLGDRPEGSLSESIQFANANFARDIGSFAPTIDRDDQLIEFEKEQAKLQREMRDELREIRRRRGVFR